MPVPPPVAPALSRLAFPIEDGPHPIRRSNIPLRVGRLLGRLAHHRLGSMLMVPPVSGTGVEANARREGDDDEAF